MTNEQIDNVFNSMPAGVAGFCCSWGYQQFARAILDADISQRLNVNKVARILSDRNADACGVNREDTWNAHHTGFILDALAVLEAI